MNFRSETLTRTTEYFNRIRKSLRRSATHDSMETNPEFKPSSGTDVDTLSGEPRYNDSPSLGIATYPDSSKTETLEKAEYNPIRESKWRVPLHGFESYVTSLQQQTPSGFTEQFEELATVGTTQSTDAGKDPVNLSKNLFKNILPYDETRVKLKEEEGVGSDYINASYVDGHNSSSEYIACQLPTPKEYCTWWRLVWEKNVTKIILMESPRQSKRNRARNLWPLEKGELCEFGYLKVQWLNESNLGFCTAWKVVIWREKHRRIVMVYELTTPKFDTSQDTVLALVYFRHFIREELKKDTLRSPHLLVCCKLGTGRTGTFICFDRVLESAPEKGFVDIYHTLQSMRKKRMQLVQSLEQYELVHLCILHVVRDGSLRLNCEETLLD